MESSRTTELGSMKRLLDRASAIARDLSTKEARFQLSRLQIPKRPAVEHAILKASESKAQMFKTLITLRNFTDGRQEDRSGAKKPESSAVHHCQVVEGLTSMFNSNVRMETRCCARSSEG